MTRRVTRRCRCPRHLRSRVGDAPESTILINPTRSSRDRENRASQFLTRTGRVHDSSREDRPKTLVERLLSPIADVRRGEAGSALLMTLMMFLVLAAYYLLKTAREVFILSEGGAEVKSYSSAGQALLLLLLVPAYGAFASRVNRVQLVQWVTLFFASQPRAVPARAAAPACASASSYFLWVGIFNVMVIAQFWAFAADLYTQEQGKRLFPLIGVGSSLGAWVGLGSRRAARGERRPDAACSSAAAAILVVCALPGALVDRVDRARDATRQAAGRRRQAARRRAAASR